MWTTLDDEKYKTDLCNRYRDTGKCKYGTSCGFAHGVHDLRKPGTVSPTTVRRSKVLKRSRSRSVSKDAKKAKEEDDKKEDENKNKKSFNEKYNEEKIQKYFTDLGLCHSCGDKEHLKSEDCKVKMAPPGEQSCAYCGVPGEHVVPTCTSLHAQCKLCGKGGHSARECAEKTTEEWLVKYITSAAQGVGTGQCRRGPFAGKFGFGFVSVKARRLSEATVQLVKDYHEGLKARLKGERVTPLPVDFGGEEEKKEEEEKSGKRRQQRRSKSPASKEGDAEDAVNPDDEAKSLPPDQTFVLQNYFDDKSKNPKDDDVRYLSKALYLDQKIVAAWFKLARRKSTK